MSAAVVRVAMWSGPRTVSTALMRAFENRADTVVVDEPLYGHYLAETGVDHPGRDDILAHHETDWRTVVAQLLAPLPPGVAVLYQKHMAHHLTASVDRDWIGAMVNAFLVRDPRAMLASYVRTRGHVTLADTGLVQQVELFRELRQAGVSPPVIDSDDVLSDPRRVLGQLCDAVGIPFEPTMLSWPAGPRDSDGVWARHWYAGVEASTGFGPPVSEPPQLPQHLEPLVAQCRPLYDELHQHRLR